MGFMLKEGQPGLKLCSLIILGRTYIFQAVKILVTLAARLAVEWLLLFHAHSARVRRTSLRVDNGKGSVTVLVQLLSLMAMSLVIPSS